MKRYSSDETTPELNKRVKTEVFDGSFDHQSMNQTSLVSAPSVLAAPLSIVNGKSIRSMAEEFMAECAANGLDLDLSSSSATESENRSPTTISYESDQYGPNSACGSMTTDQLVTPTTPSFSGDTVPPFPVDGVAILQQAATDMLKLLVEKTAPERERQLQVAVGTIRTCLEVDFVPHLEAWQASSNQQVQFHDHRYDQHGPGPDTLAPKGTQLCINKPTPSPPDSPNNLYLSPETLRNQLSGALIAVDNLQKDLKRCTENYNRAKDDASRFRSEKDEAIWRSNEDMKRMSARLAAAEHLAQPMSFANFKTARNHANPVENANISRNNAKCRAHLDQIKALEGVNKKLKDRLANAGLDPNGGKKKKKGEQVINKPLETIIKGGEKAVKLEIKPDPANKIVHNGQGGLPTTPTWVQAWETNGKAKSPRVQAMSSTSSKAPFIPMNGSIPTGPSADRSNASDRDLYLVPPSSEKLGRGSTAFSPPLPIKGVSERGKPMSESGKMQIDKIGRS